MLLSVDLWLGGGQGSGLGWAPVGSSRRHSDRLQVELNPAACVFILGSRLREKQLLRKALLVEKAESKRVSPVAQAHWLEQVT